MAPSQSTAKTEREKKLHSVLAFASGLAKRFENTCDASLVDDLQSQIRGLPLQTSSNFNAKQNELDEVGTELWNLSTRLRRDGTEAKGRIKEDVDLRNRSLCLLRVVSFLILDSASGQGLKASQRKNCIRLMKAALKAARVCIDDNELNTAVKVLERAAEYQEKLSVDGEDTTDEDALLGSRLRAEYFAVRMTLAWRQERIDMAEHMFAKCHQLRRVLIPTTAEQLADLLFEIGRNALTNRNYEGAIRWLERAHDILGESDLEMLSAEVGELRLSIMQSIVQAYMKLKTVESHDKAWQMVKLMETDYGDKMVVSLLKLELLSEAETLDTSEFYNVLLRMIRTVVLTEINFKTIMHHIHKLRDHSNMSACKALDDLIHIRLFREENQTWVEKVVITRIWLGVSNTCAEDTFETLNELFDTVLQNLKASFTAPGTHAAQTLLWKQVETALNQERHGAAELWCRLCLHPLFDKAGVQNKAKIARKIIQCALSKQDYAAAREAHSQMPITSRDDPMTRYLLYKVALRSGDDSLGDKLAIYARNMSLTVVAADCLELVCRNSSKDASLLYACVMDAQSVGDKRQAINALERVLDKYEFSTSDGIHLPALLRCSARLLQSELLIDGEIDTDIMNRLCNIFEGACTQAKASRRRPITPSHELFTAQEIEWFSKNTYNISLKYCAKMPPANLVRLLNTCIEFIKLFQEKTQSGAEGEFCLRLVFCEFLAACAFTTLARAEDNTEQCLQFYLEARNHSQNFRHAAADGIHELGGSAQADIISKHFQVVKLELEAVLKLSKWDELDDLFDQCWKYKSPDHYETLADLVLVIHSCVLKAELDAKYQSRVLGVLQKIINLACRQPGSDLTKLSRWLRCLFSLSLDHDEKTSLKCIEQATHLAATKQGNSQNYNIPILNTPPPSSDHVKEQEDDSLADMEFKEVEPYPKMELEWLATTTFNRAIDYYMQEDDGKCKMWAEKSFVLAQWLDDNGALRDLLMEKFAGLHWDK